MNDADERQRVVRERLGANKQRLARRAYLANLAPPLRSYLEQRPVLHTPDMDEHKALFWATEHGIKVGRYRPLNYTFHEHLTINDVVAAAHTIPSTWDSLESYFWPTSDNPMYLVHFGWVRQHLHAVWLQDSDDLGVITVNQAAGYVISVHTDHVGPARPLETVYDVALWFGSDTLAKINATTP